MEVADRDVPDDYASRQNSELNQSVEDIITFAAQQFSTALLRRVSEHQEVTHLLQKIHLPRVQQSLQKLHVKGRLAQPGRALTATAASRLHNLCPELSAHGNLTAQHPPDGPDSTSLVNAFVTDASLLNAWTPALYCLTCFGFLLHQLHARIRYTKPLPAKSRCKRLRKRKQRHVRLLLALKV